jgi:hypothetical protein
MLDSVLAHPQFEGPFIISCDASNFAISAILSQEHEGRNKPLRYASKVLNNHEIKYSVTEKEHLAVVFGVQSTGALCMGTGLRSLQITPH